MERYKDLSSFQDADAALAEIEHTLDQMLILAKLSASGLDVDRASLQKTLERLQYKIDRIADRLDSAES
ncbi:MAG: hypothetical protein K2M15_02585 [Oscillospiraceae bacterium]|nr:hypothetical protein [Oscillospiraceae bacterium]MDE7171934.1 hypothetical protein [Oscillospiraceae bacterium]